MTAGRSEGPADWRPAWLRRGVPAAPSVVVAGRELPIAVRRLPQARRLTLRLAPDGSEARVSMPRWGREADAIAFVHTRAGWLADQLRAMPRAAPPVPGGSLRYRGDTLAIRHDPAAPRRPSLEATSATVRLGGPAATLPARLQRWLEGEALRLTAADLAHYCVRAGLPAPRLALSRARRRWGSCSQRGAVRVNWRLVMAPDAVRRAVVAHEVAHLSHFDHSPAFRAHLAQLFDGDLAATDAWLRREGPALYAPFG